jgi:outer membrane protein OmpA-like peptidoglycan-associated protein
MKCFFEMRFIIILILSFISVFCNFLISQESSKKSYKIDGGKSVYLPLGKISFADRVIDFKMGNPLPYEKYRDSSQCLHEPNYISYTTPTFLSLGCRGSITVAFTNNGFMNLAGNDLYIFEVGPSEEAAKVEISTNGKDWLFAGKISGGKSILDLSDEEIDPELVFYYLRISDLKEVCNSKTAGADIDAIGAINSVIKLTINADVLFDFDEYTLKESANTILDSLVRTIQQVDKATIQVEGHTDSDGSETYNLELSENRCHTVVEKLKLLFNKDALYDYDINSFGESKPKVTNDSPENKQINRRVEITVLPPKDYFESLIKNKLD